jgi:hypothetical protein
MKRLTAHTQKILLKIFLDLQPTSRTEGGYIIVVVAGMVVAMSAMLLTGELVSRVDNNSTKASGNSAAGFYAAEAGLNLRAKAIRSKFEGYNIPSGTSPSSGSACRNSSGIGEGGSGDFACDNSLDIQDYLYPNDSTKRIPVSTYVIDANLKDAYGVPQPTFIDKIETGEPFAGLSAQEYRYDVGSSAFDKANNPTAFLGIRFKSRLVPLFQFALFYEQDLDFQIPPTMQMSGPIHTNSNLYLDAANSYTLSIGSATATNSKITTAGSLFRGARLSNVCNGTVSIFDPSPSPGSMRNLDCGSSRKQYVQSEVDSWDKQIEIGIPRLTLPPISEFEAAPGRKYWDSADLRIVLKLNSSEQPTGIEVQTASGSADVAATNSLLGNTCAPTTTALRTSEAVAQTALGVTNSSTTLTNFPVGSILQIEPSGTSSYVNNSAVDNDANVVSNSASDTLTIRKQLLGAPTNPATFPIGAVVRKATVWTSDTFWNYREKVNTASPSRNDAKQIRMLNVDMEALMTCAGTLMGKTIDDTSDGGLVWFFTVKGPNSSNDVTTGGTPNRYGIRLYKGQKLASTNTSHPNIKGLSVISDQAVYIRGDYNSNNKKPAAVMADTINVLSNSWSLDDSASRTYVGGAQDTATPVYISTFNNSSGYNTGPGRPASDTTINAAFLSGIDLSGGGVNNYPRLHEDWRDIRSNTFSRTLTYRGSMVSLGLPKRVNAPFCGSGSTNRDCNIYNPPTRNWDYDKDFNIASNLPPLTPRFVYLRQERFSREYNRTSYISQPLFPFASLFLPTSKMLFNF